MAARKAREIPAALEKTRRWLERWRQSRAAKSRIPERLWDAAVKMAERYGLARTASVLRLDYYRLKNRLEQNAASRCEAPAAAVKTTFIQLPLPAEPASSRPAPILPAPAECVVELDNGAGAKMRIHLKGAEAPDLAALSRSFFGGAS